MAAAARLGADAQRAVRWTKAPNHLSPALVEDLAAALAEYEGMLVVTHDRRLCRRWTGAHLAVQAILASAAWLLTSSRL